MPNTLPNVRSLFNRKFDSYKLRFAADDLKGGFLILLKIESVQRLKTPIRYGSRTDTIHGEDTHILFVVVEADKV